MIRDEILSTKRHELGNLLTSRKRKLQELYHATVAFAGPLHSSDRSPVRNGFTNPHEAAFLEANDILKGRYFDINTIVDVHARLRNRAKITADVNEPIADAKVLPNLSHDTYRSSKTTDRRSESTFREPLQPKNTDNDSNGTITIQAPSHEKLTDFNSERSQSSGTQANYDASGNKRSGSGNIRQVTQGSRSRHHSQQASDQALDNPRLQQDPSSLPHDTLQDRVGDAKAQVSQVASQDGGSSSISKPQYSEAKNFAADKSSQASRSRNNVGSEIGEKASVVVGTALDEPYRVAQDHAEDRPRNERLPDISQEETTSLRQDSQLLARDAGCSPGTRHDLPRQSVLDKKSNMHIDTDLARASSLPVVDSVPESSTSVNFARNVPNTPAEDLEPLPEPSSKLRHNPVSQILGEPSKPAAERATAAVEHAGNHNQDIGTQTPRSAGQLFSPNSLNSRPHSREPKEKDRNRSKLSTVVFPRQQIQNIHKSSQSRVGGTQRRDKGSEPRDYLVTLFATQATAQTPSLSHLIATSSKVLNTDNHYLEYHETQDTRMLKRIYHLQNSNRWSLRQMERSKEPERPTSHWDMLLGELKWMQTDFREERKWKTATARNLAEWCAEWVDSSSEQRQSLQVRVRKTSRHLSEDNRITPLSIPNASGSSRSEMTPDLIPSLVDDASDIADEEIPAVDLTRTLAPAALFSLGPEDILFSVHETPSSERLLEELPFFEIYKDPQGRDRTYSAILDGEWQKPLVPISKYVTQKMSMKERGPMRKRSRYEYEEEEEIGRDSLGRTLLPLAHGKICLVPEKDDVALFNPENKHIISRLHAAHAFRPPSEFNMPSQSFFESRSPSQWTIAEDDQLRKLVREYEYNWSLIATCCSSTSLLSSSAERRTPWECFERWVSFEGLPGDMAKHQYFRAWNARRDGAREHLEQLFHAQQASSNASQIPVKRRTTEPVTVQQRRQTKHVALVHGMFKLAKKREATLQKQQHVASLAAMRKATEPAQPRQRMQTPREFSAHKHKQELDYREKQSMYRQQLLASQRAALAQKTSQQPGQQLGSTGPQLGRGVVPPQPNGASSNHLTALPVGALPSGSRSLQHAATTNTVISNGAPMTNDQTSLRGVGNVPQAAMQSYLQGQQRLPSQNGQDRIVLEAARLQEQQRIMQQQRQQQGQVNNGIGNPPSSSYNGNFHIPIQSSSAMGSNLQSANGKMNAASNGTLTQPRTSTSPGIAENLQSQQTASGVYPVLSQIQNQLKAMHPQASPEQIRQMATVNLSQQLRNYQQVNNNNGIAMNPNMQLSPQQQMAFNANANVMNSQIYASYLPGLRSQQANRNGAAGGANGSPNGDANAIRPSSQGSVGAVQGRSGSMPSGSPRPPQAQLAGSP